MKRVFVPSLLLFAAAMSCPVPPVATSQPIAQIVKVLPAQTPAGSLEVQGEGVRTITQVSAFPVFIKAPPGADLYLWKYPIVTTVTDNSTDTLIIKDAIKGEQTISVLCWKVDWDAKKTIKQTYSVTIVVGDIVPVPPGPTPPGPNPPNPPTPDPAPISEAGLHVLIVYESAELSKLPPAQLAIMYSQPFREYLDSVCAAGTGNFPKAWRIYDKDTDTSKESKAWQDGMKLERKSIPWLIVSNPGKGGFQGPLPANVEETKKIIEKYKG